MKFFLKIIFLTIAIAILGYVLFNFTDILLAPNLNEGLNEGLNPQVCYKDYCFNVELAQNNAERTNGLARRGFLKENEGMLFVFEREGNYPFWMKNTLIPLDIIWISQNNKIVFVSENNLPCGDSDCPLINPAELAKYVLEINAGMAEKIGIKIGERVVLK